MVIVVLAVVEDKGRFLLIQESKERIRGKWNLPGGRVEPGESVIDALLREVREEAGLEVTLSGLLYMDQTLSDGADGAGRMRFVFRATPRTQVLKSEPDEHSLRAQWFSASDLLSVTLRNSIVNQMVELAVKSSPAVPMSSVRVLSMEDRERERLEEQRGLTMGWI